MAKKQKELENVSILDSGKGRCKSDIIFDAIIFIILTTLFLIVAYPLYFVVISSISDPIAVANGDVVWFPIGFTLDGYARVFQEKTVMRGFVNSVVYTVVGVMINLAVTIPTAYALSRKDFKGRGVVMAFYMLTMFVSGGMMPTYLIIRDLHMLDTIWSLVIPGALSVYNMIVARTFFQTNIPSELMEASKIDGCGNSRFFFSICLPLSGAIIAIMVLYYGVGHWNSYFGALMYITDRKKWPLQMELRNILIQNALQMTQQVLSEEALKEKARNEALTELMKYSLIIISSIPMLVMYPFIQKHFVKGVTVGSVKG